MSAPSYVREPQLITLQGLFEDLRNGALRVPRFQRRFVWDSERRLNLLDSIKRGIPLGSILTWRTTQNLATFPRVGGVTIPKSRSDQMQYLLDGHQRVSTLFSAFQPSTLNPDPDAEEWELDPGDIVYDLEDERFVLRKDYQRMKGSAANKGLPLNLLFEGAAYMRFLRENYSMNESLVQRADLLTERFRTYKLPLVPLATDDLGMVLEAFQRVNSAGVIMSDAHIVHALSYTTGFDLMEHLERASKALEEVGWGDLDHKYILAVIRGLTGQPVTVPAPKDEAVILKENPSLIDQAVDSIKKVADWLWVECKIASPAFLPYSYQLPLLTSVFNSLSTTQLAKNTPFYRTWFWKASLTGIFRSMRENDYVKARENLTTMNQSFEAFDRRKNVGITTGSFYFQRSRVKIVMLQMLQKRLKKNRTEQEEARRYLQQAGAYSMKSLLKKQQLARSDVGTKFIAIKPDENGYSFDAALPKELREELFISSSAELKFKQRDETGLFNEREIAIQEFEREFIASLGLDSNDEDRQN